MMMVDTINPNTDQPDDFANNIQQPVPPIEPTNSVLNTEPNQDTSSQVPVDSGNDHFFGGFDRPDEMKINLAGVPGQSSETSSNQDNIPAMPPQPAAEPKPFNDLAPAESETNPFEAQIHSSYNKNQSPDSKAPLIIVTVGIIATLVISSVTYLIINNANNTKLKAQQDELSNLTANLKSLGETPASLQETTTTTAETPTTESAENTTTEQPTEETTTTTTTVPATTNIETTTTTVPEKNNQNSAQAAG